MEKPFAQIHQDFVAAIADLWWVSETDAPWTVEVWSDLTPLTTQTAQTVMPDLFFAAAIAIQDWYCEAEITEAKRYQTLVELLQQHCTNCQVYRVGQVEVEIYVVGQISDHWIVLKTRSVET